MARRVNTKFLTILTVSVIGLLVVALLASKFFFKASPEKYVAQGKEMMGQKKYDAAVQYYATAVALDSKNPETWIAYGDALNQLSPTDIEYMGRARKAWETALTLDSSNKPALDRMMQFWSDVTNIEPNSLQGFEGLHGTAVKLAAADPTNAAAEIAVVTSVVRPWLVGVEKDNKFIDENIEKLMQLMAKYPENPDLPLFAAQAKLRKADRERQRDRQKDADVLTIEADQIMADAVKRAPSAAMYFSAAQVAQIQGYQRQISPGLTASAAEEATKKEQARMAAAIKLKGEYHAKARELVKLDDPLYVFIHASAARAAADRPEAEKILRELYKNCPDDQQVRLVLAEQLALDRTKRKEAMEILEQPFAQTGLIGPKAYMVRELQTRTLINFTNLRIEEYAVAKDPERANMLPSIEDGLAKIVLKDGEGPRTLRLRGKLLRIQGRNIEAIQTLEKARALTDKTGARSGDTLDRWEVIDLLAKAYIETQQNGQAIDLLTDLVGRFPDYDPARMLLAQLLIKSGKFDDAKYHVDFFVAKLPNDPDVIKLKLQLLDPKTVPTEKDPAQEASRIAAISQTYTRLPERTKAEMLDKVNAAMVVKQTDDAMRLLKILQEQNPGDVDVTRVGVRVHRSLGDVDAAKAVVEAALKVNPNDEKLQILKRQVADLTNAGLIQVRREEAMKNPDLLARELILADCDRRENKLGEALKHLQAAQRMKPDNSDITALIFDNYLSQKQWDKAELLLDPLTKANQDDTHGVLFRYRLAMAKQDYPAALIQATKLTQAMSEFGQSWLALAQVQQISGQYEEALKNYGSALEKQSDSADALRGIIECYYALSRPVDAVNKIRDARRALPNNAYFQELEVTHELNYGKPENAIPPREEEAKKHPERPGNILSLGQTYLAVARLNQNKPETAEKAAELFTKARQTFRQGITKWPDEISFYAYYAEAGARSGVPGDSEELLKKLGTRDAWKDKPEPQMLLAEFYAVSNRPADAEATLRALLAKNPENIEAELRLANLFVAENKVDDALKALDTNAQDSRISRRRIEVLISALRYDEADKALDELLARTPSNVELLQLAGSLALSRQKFDIAEQRFTRALEIDPNNPTIHYFIGLLNLNRPTPNIDEAIKHLTLGKSSPVMGIESRLALADCLRRKSDVDASIRELEEALKIQPGNRRVRLVMLDSYTALQPPRWVDVERLLRDAKNLPGAKPDPDLLSREAAMWAARGEPKTAVAKINEALTLNPDDMNLQRSALNLLLRARQYPDVVQRADQLVAKDPNLWWAYQSRAVARRNQDRKEDAITDFEAAITAANVSRNDGAIDEIVRTMGDVIGPVEAIKRIASRAEKEDRWKIMVARLQQASGDNAAAVRTLEQVLAREDQLSPQDKENAYRFGGTLYLMGGVSQPQKSYDCYKKLLATVPNDMTSLNNMAFLLAEVMQPPRPEEGLEYSQRAYDLMQKGGRRDPLVLDTHGWLLTLSGQVDPGIEILRTANEIRSLPDAHYHLGEAYLRKQFGDEARREFDLAMELIRRAEDQKQPIDPSLKARVQEAIIKADAMIRQKTTANTPLGVSGK